MSETKYKTREEWLRAAVPLINEKIFSNEFEIEQYQVSSALLGGNKLGETVMPYQGEDVGLDDFFPPTIHIDEKIKEPETLIATLAHEMIHAFGDVKGHGKAFGRYAGPAGFEKPYAQLSTNETLSMLCREVAKELGSWPGKALTIHPKEKKTKTFSGVLFCPECGYELKVSEKMFNKHNQGLPVCPCGCHMALDCSDENPTEE